MLGRKYLCMFMLLAALLAALPTTAMAAEPPPPDTVFNTAKEPQSAPGPPPVDVKISTVIGGAKSNLSGPGGASAVLSAIMNYYQQYGLWWSRSGSKIDLISGTSSAFAYATLKQGAWSSPVAYCQATGTGECTAWTSYYSSSGLVIAQADTTVYWSGGGHSIDTEYVSHTF